MVRCHLAFTLSLVVGLFAASVCGQTWLEADYFKWIDAISSDAGPAYDADTTLLGVPVQQMTDLRGRPTLWGAVPLLSDLSCPPTETLVIEVVLQLDLGTTRANETHATALLDDILIGTFRGPLDGHTATNTTLAPASLSSPLLGIVVRESSPAGPESLRIALEVPLVLSWNDTGFNQTDNHPIWLGIAPTIPFGTATAGAAWALTVAGPADGYYFTDTANLLGHHWDQWTLGSATLLSKMGIRGDFHGLAHQFRCCDLGQLDTLRHPIAPPDDALRWHPQPMWTKEALIATGTTFAALCLGLVATYHYARFKYTYTRERMEDVLYQDISQGDELGLRESDFHELDSREE